MKTAKICTLLLVIAAAGSCNFSYAQPDITIPGIENPPSHKLSNPASGLSPVFESERVSRGLTLEQFLKSVDRNFPKMKGADAERKIASAKELEKSGAFDPVLTHLSEYLRVQDTVDAGKAKDAIHNESRMDLLTRSGIRVFATMRLNPNDTKTPFVPTGKAGEYSGGILVPLSRGLGINEKTAAETQARLGVPLAQEIFKSTRLEIMLKAAISYWDWVGARARIDVAQNLLAIARNREEQIRGRVEKGDLPAIEIAEAEQEIQRRTAAVVKADRDLQKATITLSLFLWDENGSPVQAPSRDEIPPLPQRPAKVTEAERLEARRFALESRPELKRISKEREIVKVELRLARNLMTPAVDAFLTQGADTGPQGIGTVVRGGMAVTMPLRQRTARGQEQAALLKLQKLSMDERAEKLRIQSEVDDTVSALNTSCERYDATLAEVKKARDVESGERLRFQAGDSTLFLVNQRERTTAEAEMRRIDTHVDFLQALAAYRAVTCRL